MSGAFPNVTTTLGSGVDGHLVGRSKVTDSSATGYTETWTFQTPAGTVTVKSGGSNPPAAEMLVGKTGPVSGQYAIASSTDPSISTGHSGGYSEFAAVNGLQYASYGYWELNPCANFACVPKYVGTYGGGAPGVPETASMPTTGSASYSGGAVGRMGQPASVNGTSIGNFYGTIGLTADFAAGTISGSVTGIQVYGPTVNTTPIGSANDVMLSGTIAGSAFNGTATAGSNAGTAFDISGASGELHGGFYGPNAAETGGVFSLTGGANSIFMTGGFGAKQAAPSDLRLKRDVESLGTLANGLGIYAWRYLGGTRRFTGVIAQEMLADERFADAVLIDGDGLMWVDYGRLGVIPHDYAAMVEDGEAAIALYRKGLH